MFRWTDGLGTEFEFRYVVNSPPGDEPDQLLVRKVGETDWQVWGEDWGDPPAAVEEHFHGPMIRQDRKEHA